MLPTHFSSKEFNRPLLIERNDKAAIRWRSPTAIVFIAAIVVAMTFALITDERWEDFYITYRASKNLALGNGLVFQVGERVHTFTSPLGVLLPAFTASITGGRSDEAALWAYRMISIVAFGGSVALFWQAGGAWGWRISTRILAAAWLMTDAKSVAFSINGMETAFVLLFLAWSIFALTVAPPGARFALGFAWAGLMWARPDSFIHIGAMVLAFWIFPSAQRLTGSRRILLREFVIAAVIAGIVYAPWLIWSTWYYGTPIPNTVVAKGLNHGNIDWIRAGLRLITIPFQAWHSGAWDHLFTPPYAIVWPIQYTYIGRLLAFIPMTVLLWPKVRPEARAMSLAAIIGTFYLSCIWVFPWYVPPISLLAVAAFAGATESVRGWSESVRFIPRSALIGAAAIAAGMLGICASTLRQQQSVIESQRRQTGEWLRDHRHSARDSVFLEPLGYIGFYSQLKMLDIPGLSSREVIQARRQVGDDWIEIIRQLRPDWVVARPGEPHSRNGEIRAWFQRNYALQAHFDVSGKVAMVAPALGRGLLQADQEYLVYRRIQEPSGS